MHSFRTQKANGLIYGLSNLGNRLSRYHLYLASIPNHKIIQNVKDINSYHINYPVFARPCPKYPRHGFVESQTVNNYTELRDLFEKVMKEDKEGEIALGPHFRKVLHNAVYVDSGLLSIGPGNDGATGGHKSMSLPVAPTSFDANFRKDSKLSENDSIYIEHITSTHDVGYYTQVRGGPNLKFEVDYVPNKIVVKNVVVPHDDLLLWEKQAKSFPPGTVVNAIGHTLASHAAIHCVINKIPFITSKKVKVGDALEPSKSKSATISRNGFRLGYEAANAFCRKPKISWKMRENLLFALTVLHNWSYIKNSNHSDWLLGAAAAMYYKICCALIMGEARHHIGSRKYYSRDSLYSKTMRKGVSAADLVKATKVFYNNSWKNNFGGLPWANCSYYTCLLYKQIAKVYNKKSINVSEREITDLISTINRATNLAHNNGWWFNKISSTSDLDAVANEPGLMSVAVSSTIYSIMTLTKKAKVQKSLEAMPKLSVPAFIHPDRGLTWLRCVSLHKGNSYFKTKPTAELTFFSENGKRGSRIVDLNSKEATALGRRFDMRDKLRLNIHNCFVPIEVKASGKFTLGGRKIRTFKGIATNA